MKIKRYKHKQHGAFSPPLSPTELWGPQIKPRAQWYRKTAHGFHSQVDNSKLLNLGKENHNISLMMKMQIHNLEILWISWKQMKPYVIISTVRQNRNVILIFFFFLVYRIYRETLSRETSISGCFQTSLNILCVYSLEQDKYL